MCEQTRPRERAAAQRRPLEWFIGAVGGVRRVAQRSAYVTTMLAISLGAAIGANLRYALSLWAAQQWGASFPYGTLLINVLGSLVLGFIMALGATRITISIHWRLLLITGMLGGFTTFSTFSYETYDLFVRGSWAEAGLNILASIGISLVGVLLGASLARSIP
jgi:fluoride exporter